MSPPERRCAACCADISHRIKPGPGRPPSYCEAPETFTTTVPVTRRGVDTGRRVERAYRSIGTTRCQWARENRRKADSDHRKIKADPERFGIPAGLPKRAGACFIPDDGSGPRPLQAEGIVHAAIAGFSDIDTVFEVEADVVDTFTASKARKRGRRTTASPKTIGRLNRVHRPQAEHTILDLPAHRDDPGALWLAGKLKQADREAHESQDRLLRALNPSGETVTPDRSPVIDEDELEADATALDGVEESIDEPVEAPSRAEPTPGRREFEAWLDREPYAHPAPFIPSTTRTTPARLQRALAERGPEPIDETDFGDDGAELRRAA